MNNLQELSLIELQTIDGGHDGMAHDVGVAVGKAVKLVGGVLVLVAIFTGS
ncbi:hypothetical protein ACR1PO_06910 [Chryseobacterium sp. RRHN12]|uniref:hypothetical protein n=1 Tax=Chryseobacterium sp. RRHN12 TaxID=3437884 RepID=UPI002FC8FD81